MARRRASTTAPTESLAVVGTSWSRHLRAEGKSPQTVTTYLKAVNSLADFLPAGTPAAAVTRSDLVDWLVWLRDERGYEPATRSQRHRSIQQLFRWMIQSGDMTTSPLDGISPPRIPDAPPPVLTVEQQQALLATVRGTSFADRRDAALLRVLMATGIRRGEAASIRLADLDLDREQLVVEGKTGRRVVSFGKKCTLALDRYLRMRAVHRYANAEALWLGERGPMTVYGIEQTVKTAAVAAGLPWVSCHTFRHTFAAQSLDGGMGETDLASIAGWRSLQMVQRYGRATRHDRALRVNRAKNPGDLV